MREEEIIMNRLPATLLGLLILLAPNPVAAAPFDGSQPILCAVAETFECQSGVECKRGRAESINLPEFLEIDFKKKRILSTEKSGKKDATTITAVSQADGMLLLHGTDAYHGWSIAIGDTGKMSLALSAHQVGFVVFGACTAM